MRTAQSGPELESTIVTLAEHLGAVRVEIGSIRALKAVLAKQIWPDKFKRNPDWMKAYDAKAKNFYEYSRKVSQLLELAQSGGADNSGCGSGACGSHTVGCGTSDVSGGGSSAAGAGAVQSQAHDAHSSVCGSAPGGPHHSPPDDARSHSAVMDSSDHRRPQHFDFDIEVDELLRADPGFVDPWLSALASADELWHSESFMS